VRKESDWVYHDVVVPLNRKLKEAASALGWTLVGDSRVNSDGTLGTTGGIMGRSRTHGICNCTAGGYFNTFVQSYLRQGDHQGAIHPNPLGYSRMYRSPIAVSLNRVRPAAARRIVSSDRLVSTTAGDLDASGVREISGLTTGHAQTMESPLNKLKENHDWTDRITAMGKALGDGLLQSMVSVAVARDEPGMSPEDEALTRGPPAGKEKDPPAARTPSKEAVSRAHEQARQHDSKRVTHHGRPDYKGLPNDVVEVVKKQNARKAAALEELERGKQPLTPARGQDR
jgi:hypothetical protein